MKIQLKDLLHPKYWPSWLLVFFAFIILNCLTQNGRMRLGYCLTPFIKVFMRYRLLVSRTNIELCFADDPQKAKEIYRKHVISLGKGMIESLSCYLVFPSRLEGLADFAGDQHMQDAIARKKGVILISVHYTGLEIGSLLTSGRYHGFGMYRPMVNKVFDYVIYRSRLRFAKGMIEQSDIRGLIKTLKSGETVWYAADQDFGRKGSSHFAPFYGIPAYTLTLYAQIAKKTGATVLPTITYRDDKTNRYIVQFLDIIEPDRYADPEKAALTMNQTVEALIEGYEDQYYWLHRRFKTRPDGEDSFYPEKPSRLKRQAKRRKKAEKLK